MAETHQNERFAFGDDDGNEAGHSLDAENTARGAQVPDVTFLIRIQVEETGGADDTWTFQLFAQKNGGGGFTAVTTTRADGIKLANDTQSRADNEATTERLTAGAGSFLAGYYDDGQTEDGMGSALVLNAQYTDLEFAIQVDSANASASDFWEFRIEENDGTDLDSYPGTLPKVTADIEPEISVSSGLTVGELLIAPELPQGWLVGYGDLDFEEGDKTDFDNEDNSGNIAVNASAAMIGSYGCEITLSSTTTWGRESITLTTNAIRARIYFDPNNCTVGNGEAFYLFEILTDSSYGSVDSIGSIAYRDSSGTKQVVGGIKDDANNTYITSPITCSDQAHYVEILIKRETYDGAGDGYCEIWLDGVASGGPYTTADNWNIFRTVDEVAIGCRSVDAGTSGTIYLDDVLVRDDDTEIGEQPEISVSDGITIADVVDDVSVSAGVATWEVDVSDGITIADTPALAQDDLIVSKSDDVTVGDAPSLVQDDKTLDISDDITVGESTSTTLDDHKVGVSDGITVGDTPALAQDDEAISVTDDITIADVDDVDPPAAPGVPDRNIDVDDGLTIGETVNVPLDDLQFSITDSITVGETTAAEHDDEVVSVSDGITLGESTTAQHDDETVNVSDGLIVGESVDPELVSLISVSDNVTITDIPRFFPDNIYIGEYVEVEVVDVTEAKTVSVTDGLTIGESTSAELSDLQVDVTDDITIGENVTAALSTSAISVADNIPIGDNVTTNLDALTFSLSDNVTVADAVSAQVIDVTPDLDVLVVSGLTLGESVEVYAFAAIIEAWTLHSRTTTWTIEDRDLDLDLLTRGTEWTIEDRDLDWSIRDRDTAWTVEDR